MNKVKDLHQTPLQEQLKEMKKLLKKKEKRLHKYNRVLKSRHHIREKIVAHNFEIFEDTSHTPPKKKKTGKSVTFKDSDISKLELCEDSSILSNASSSFRKACDSVLNNDSKAEDSICNSRDTSEVSQISENKNYDRGKFDNERTSDEAHSCSNLVKSTLKRNSVHKNHIKRLFQENEVNLSDVSIEINPLFYDCKEDSLPVKKSNSLLGNQLPESHFGDSQSEKVLETELKTDPESAEHRDMNLNDTSLGNTPERNGFFLQREKYANSNFSNNIEVKSSAHSSNLVSNKISQIVSCATISNSDNNDVQENNFTSNKTVTDNDLPLKSIHGSIVISNSKEANSVCDGKVLEKENFVQKNSKSVNETADEKFIPSNKGNEYEIEKLTHNDFGSHLQHSISTDAGNINSAILNNKSYHDCISASQNLEMSDEKFEEKCKVASDRPAKREPRILSENTFKNSVRGTLVTTCLAHPPEGDPAVLIIGISEFSLWVLVKDKNLPENSADLVWTRKYVEENSLLEDVNSRNQHVFGGGYENNYYFMVVKSPDMYGSFDVACLNFPVNKNPSVIHKSTSLKGCPKCVLNGCNLQPWAFSLYIERCGNKKCPNSQCNGRLYIVSFDLKFSLKNQKWELNWEFSKGFEVNHVPLVSLTLLNSCDTGLQSSLEDQLVLWQDQSGNLGLSNYCSSLGITQEGSAYNLEEYLVAGVIVYGAAIKKCSSLRQE